MEHIAILRQPFYDMILSGEKTIESRFSMNKCAPYKRVSIGDVVWFKETGKPVTVRAIVKDVKYFETTPEIIEEIRKTYGKEIGTDRFEDWQETCKKNFCTLVWIKDVKRVPPINVPRSNGAGWIILNGSLGSIEETDAEIERWKFGTDNAKLIDLVLRGKKTATTYLTADENDVVGKQSIIVDDNGKDACLVETTAIHKMKFCDMTWELAKLEGENKTLKEWKEIHEKYFKKINKNFNENTKIIFEIFKLVKKY